MVYPSGDGFSYRKCLDMAPPRTHHSETTLAQLIFCESKDMKSGDGFCQSAHWLRILRYPLVIWPASESYTFWRQKSLTNKEPISKSRSFHAHCSCLTNKKHFGMVVLRSRYCYLQIWCWMVSKCFLFIGKPCFAVNIPFFWWFLLPAFFTLGDSTVLQPPEALFGQVNWLVING